MADSGTFDPETIANRQKIADQLLMQATKPREIRHWAQGLGQMGEAAIAGILSGLDDRERREGTKSIAEAIATQLNGGAQSPAPPMAAPTAVPDQAPPTQSAAAPPPTSDFMPNLASLPPGPTPAPMDANAKAIAGIESGGAYDKLGPMTKGDRAYGKYQVMGANVPAWTKAHLGREMTPDQFLADPAAQDAVFKGQFGQYASKYGNEGAARAWFAGEGGMNDPNRKDILGTSVADYASKFNKGVGAQPTPQASPVAAALAQPQQVAQNAPAAAPGAPTDNRAAIVNMLNNKNPYVRKMGIQLGQSLIQKQLEGDKPTDEMREYNLYRQQGGKDSFFDYKSGLKKAGAQNITIDQKGQTSFEQKAGEVQAKRFDELASEAPKAKQMIADVQTLTELGKTIKTGKGAQVRAAIGPYADALGIKIEGLDDIQAFEAIVNRVAPSLRVPGSGAQSDYELKNFLKSLPNLGNTEGGNEIASAVMQGLYQNKVKAAEIGSQALNGQISRPDAEKALRELPDPLEQYREFMKKNKNAPAAATAAPDRSAIEAEMKRRGLIK